MSGYLKICQSEGLNFSKFSRKKFSLSKDLMKFYKIIDLWLVKN